MSNDGFDLKMLSEKLSKLNNSQQSIESLSRWCVSNRKKARQIVETWEKMFNSSSKEQCVSFLYLANDILQTSRRKGSEFVNEFWKVLPTALQHVYDNGDGSGKKAATRLVDIWEERKVFGSRVQSLRDEIVASQIKDPAPQVVSNGKTANPIKIVKKDAQSLRIKLAVGGFPERIVSAFHSLHDECSNEESMLTKCNAATVSVERIVKEVEKTTSQGIQRGAGVADEIQEQENVLQQCVRRLEGAESSRASLVSLLNEAVKDQELQLETLRRQLQIARNRINEVGIWKPKLLSNDHSVSVNPISASTQPPMMEDFNNLGSQATSLQIPLRQQSPIGSNQQIPLVHQVSQIPSSFVTLTPATDEESTKATAAAVAAKLAASTSSAQMFASVLSSLVAEEAASMNDSSRKRGFSSSLPIFSPEKRHKREPPPSGPDPANLDGGNLPYFTSFQQPISSNQVSQSGVQASLGPPPPPPPPPQSLLHMNPNQFSQAAGMMLNTMPPPYGIGGSNLPPPLPLPSHVHMGLARPLIGPQGPQSLQPHQQLGQQHSGNGGFYHPSSTGLYGSISQPSTTPIHRQ